jgi:uncharacterized protein YecT (DUF1311 family)
MRRYLIFLVTLFLCVSELALAGETSPCWQAGNTMREAECFSIELTEADAKLNATYQSLIGLVRNHGEDWVEDLRKAQRKWLEFKALNCEFYGNYLKGGTGAGLYHIDCAIRMTKEREAELRAKYDEMKRRGYEEKKK